MHRLVKRSIEWSDSSSILYWKDSWLKPRDLTEGQGILSRTVCFLCPVTENLAP
jgi:hypothetical protein